MDENRVKGMKLVSNFSGCSGNNSGSSSAGTLHQAQALSLLPKNSEKLSFKKSKFSKARIDKDFLSRPGIYR